MAYDEHLADRVRHQLAQRHVRFEEKRMMGGLCLMVDGKMCLGITDDRLMVRLAADEIAARLAEPHVRPMDFTGRPLRGFLFVEAPGVDRDDDLGTWVQRALDFNPRAQASRPTRRKPGAR
jgi:TfoX/Sxy family transcriptional regulator of competence genes